MIEGLAVVSAEEMQRIEKGEDTEKLVDIVGEAVSEVVLKYDEKKVICLVGKGNKGADAYVAAKVLLEKGLHVLVYALFPEKECSPMNRKKRKQFPGTILPYEQKLPFEGVIIDGLLGTGFKGVIKGDLATCILQANASNKPIISIDIPTGVNATTGEVKGAAIIARETVTCGFPKMGLFIREGWNHTGKLHVTSLLLSLTPKPLAFLPLQIALPPLMRTRNKYQSLVIGYAGSKKYPGAPQLSSLAALKAGAGMVHLFYPEDIGKLHFPELIGSVWNTKDWNKALKKAKAIFIGPGLGKSPQIKTPLTNAHCVIDADALLPNTTYPKNSVLTPHRGEILRLLNLKATLPDEELFGRVMKFCKKQTVTVVLKGAPTFIFIPNRLPIIVPHGDPGMATAGSGDVLTGVIAAMLAQGLSSCESAVLGVTVHAIAGECAAAKNTSYSVIANDIIAHLPDAFRIISERAK